MLDIIVECIIFLIAIVGIWKGSSVTVINATKIADFFGTSYAAIGFILIAVATSMPELFVSIVSGMSNQGAIAVGNVIGSNIAAISLILGVIALESAFKISKKTMMDNVEILFFISFLPVFLLSVGGFGLITGIILMVAFCAYLFFLMRREQKAVVYSVLDVKTGKFRRARRIFPKKGISRSFVLFFGGIALTLVCANLMIDSAINLITSFVLPPSFVGITLVAFGTSIPEISISMNAIKKGFTSLAMANIIGSCVVNLTLVLGIVGILNPVRISIDIFSSAILFLIGLNMFLWYMMTKYGGVPRRFGLLLIVIYIVFILTEIGIVSGI